MRGFSSISKKKRKKKKKKKKKQMPPELKAISHFFGFDAPLPDDLHLNHANEDDNCMS